MIKVLQENDNEFYSAIQGLKNDRVLSIDRN